jgi:integrase
MLYRLVRPVKRQGSSNHQFVKRIPADLKGRLAGMTLDVPIGDETVTVQIGEAATAIRFSLRSSDPAEVRIRQASASAFIEDVFRSLRSSRPIELTHRQAVALSGEIYRAWAADLETGSQLSVEHDGTDWVRTSVKPEELEAGYASALRQVEAWIAGDADLEPQLGGIIDARLRARGIMSISGESRAVLLSEFAKALRDGLEVRRRKAAGDYSPDPKSERFPEWQPPELLTSKVPLRGLLDDWWREGKQAGLSESTHGSYSKAIDALIAFLGHDDASRVAREDVLRFKDHLLSSKGRNGKPLGIKTVKDSYLSGLRSVFNWGVANNRIASNAAADIKVKAAKRKRVRESWFRPDEIRAILTASANVERDTGEPAQRHALKRWVPWLCAYTGARVGEIVQLRKKDVRHEGGHWVITITPEAGRVKNKEAREVPLHAHLVELGFPEFLASAPEGHLFMWSGDGRGAWRNAKNRLTAFVREVVTDTHVQPNHGWRHTFKTIGSEAGIQDKVLDAICGHDPRTIGESYGGVDLPLNRHPAAIRASAVCVTPWGAG